MLNFYEFPFNNKLSIKKYPLNNILALKLIFWGKHPIWLLCQVHHLREKEFKWECIILINLKIMVKNIQHPPVSECSFILGLEKQWLIWSTNEINTFEYYGISIFSICSTKRKDPVRLGAQASAATKPCQGRSPWSGFPQLRRFLRTFSSGPPSRANCIVGMRNRLAPLRLLSGLKGWPNPSAKTNSRKAGKT